MNLGGIGHVRELAFGFRLLLEVASRTENGYILLRRRRREGGARIEWRVAVKHDGRRWTYTSLEGLQDALLRALRRLLGLEVIEHAETRESDAAALARLRAVVADQLDGG